VSPSAGFALLLRLLPSLSARVPAGVKAAPPARRREALTPAETRAMSRSRGVRPSASVRRRPSVSLMRPYGTSPKTRSDMRNNADNHNTSHPNLDRKCP